MNKREGCNVCANKKVLKGYNDLWTTRPDVAKYLKYPEVGYKITKGSYKKESFICPICKNESFKRIKDVCRNGFSCSKCSDGISYPEKFIINLLDQLKINYFFQIKFSWSQNKKYDFYIPSLNCIIEVHGKQHYNSDFSYCGGRTLKEEQENDKIKEKLANKNGIENYIIINCIKSDPEWIKNSIIQSEILKLFNCEVDDIDFKKCHEFACNSLIKTVCDIWSSGIKNTTKISQIIKVSNTTIRTYLKQGKILGWCDYDPKK